MPILLPKRKKQQITAFEANRLKTYKTLPRAANSPWIAFVDLIVGQPFLAAAGWPGPYTHPEAG